MLSFATRPPRAGLTVAALFALTTAAVGQQGGNPYFRVPAGGQQGPQAPPPAPAAVPIPMGGNLYSSYNPYSPLNAQGATVSSTQQPFRVRDSGGYPGGFYGYPPYAAFNPVGSYLSGAADVINAQSNFMLSTEQTRLQRQYVEQAKIDTRLKLAEARIREAALSSQLRDQIERDQQDYQLRRARQTVALPEIISGDTLNRLLANAQRLQGRGTYGPTIPLEDELLKHINVSQGAGGNAGLLKHQGKLEWPLALQSPEYDAERKHVDGLMADAVQQAGRGAVPAGTIRDLQQDVMSLQRTLQRNVGEMTPSQHIEAKRYLRQLEEAVRALQDPNAANYFNQTWAAKGKTVAELVKHMGQGGLRFSAATPGDEAAYRALHTALSTYESALAQQVKE